MTTSVIPTPRSATDATPGRGNRGTPYADLSRRIKAQGLLERRHAYYITRIAVTALMFLGGWTAVVLLGESWYQLIVAVFLAVVFTQMGFLGHDAGHGQILGSARASRVLGLLHGNLAIGLSYGWWISKHTRHHAHPNDPDKDPDVGVGALIFTPGQAARRRGIGALWTRSQAYLFFPLLFLEGLNLHVASVRDLIRPGRKSRWLELGLLTIHLVGYATVVFMVMSPWQAIAFIAVQQGLFGFYMGCSFAPNHKGMPVLGPEDSADFLRRQVLTSRNIRGGWFVDVVFGGLNYQIEHHLFPSMPRPSLRRAQKIVREFCADHGVSYLETGTFRSFAEALRHLHEVGEPLRQRRSAAWG
ncbi:fatty acid desaturase family protein [Luedemannella helvata]|uniref:Acyl-CoA desaturase n=1 Tax=Luedemannella helvata TaxID=349315 RepID=A0ABN2JSU8_9ACTN